MTDRYRKKPVEEITREQCEDLLTRTTVISSIKSAEFEGQDECATGACPIK